MTAHNNAYHNSICRIKITDVLTVVIPKVKIEKLLCLLFVPQSSTTTTTATTSQLDIGHHDLAAKYWRHENHFMNMDSLHIFTIKLFDSMYLPS